MVLGGEDEPRYAPVWARSWDLALEELGQDAQTIDRQLANVYWRLERWPDRYSYRAFKQGQRSHIRITFAKAGRGTRLRVWYRFENEEVEYLWVDLAPYDEGQDDPIF